MYLVINKCSRHGTYCVSIEDDHGGDRITPVKCCGLWSTVKRWELSPANWRSIAELANKAAEHER